MDAARVLYIGRSQSKRPSTVHTLEKRYHVTVATSGKGGLETARTDSFAVVILDAASMRTPGDRICKDLRQTFPRTPLLHIHPGPRDSGRSVADAIVYAPVTARKLLMALEHLLVPQDDSVVSCGPFSINLTRRVLVSNGKETRLTPKQAMLVELFLRNPGLTLDRRTLMEKVWQTSYVGDTRTLDVHVRWIREMIEEDPSKPRYLRTVRGVGYRLELEASLEPKLSLN